MNRKRYLTLLVLLSLGSHVQAVNIYTSNLLKRTIQQVRLAKHVIEGLRNCIISNNFHLVHDGLFRSAQMSTENLCQCIDNYQIKTIINLRGPNPEKEWWIREHVVAHNHDVIIVDIPLNSTQKISKEHLQQILEAYKDGIKKGSVLIHCRNGADRTSAVSAILDYNKTHDEKRALEHLSLKYGHIKEIKANMDLSVKHWICCMKQTDFNEDEALKLYN
jgi:protein tyrosine/serine phosphatase